MQLARVALEVDPHMLAVRQVDAALDRTEAAPQHVLVLVDNRNLEGDVTQRGMSLEPGGEVERAALALELDAEMRGRLVDGLEGADDVLLEGDGEVGGVALGAGQGQGALLFELEVEPAPQGGKDQNAKGDDAAPDTRDKASIPAARRHGAGRGWRSKLEFHPAP